MKSMQWGRLSWISAAAHSACKSALALPDAPCCLLHYTYTVLVGVIQRQQRQQWQQESVVSCL